MLVGGGLAYGGYWLWPYLGYTVAPAGAWLLLLMVHTWRSPRQATQFANLWLGTLVLLSGTAGVLEWYVPGWGGIAGELLMGPTFAIGVAQIASIGLVAAVILAPRQAWGLTRTAGALSAMAAAFVARMTPRTAIALGRGLRLIGGGLWAAVRGVGRALATTGRAYARHPLHRPLLRAAWRLTTLPFRLLPKPSPRPRGKVTDRSSAFIALPPPRQGAEGAESAADIVIDVPTRARTSAAPEPREGWVVAPSVTSTPPPDPRSSRIVDARPTAARSETTRPSGGASGWTPPPADILKVGERRWVSEEENRKTAGRIEEALKEYGIEVSVEEIRPGPVVTQYGLVPGWVRRYREVKERNSDGSPALDERGKAKTARVEDKTRVKVDHILAREKDLALTLAASSLRFEAPVPGESFVGLEVPNARPATVSLRSLIETDAYRSLQRRGRLPVALGQGSGGEPVVADLTDMPHLLIAGATGSGKSVCLNTVICSLITQLSPMDVQISMVDPKRVELTPYNGLPHLAGPVLVEADQAVLALQSLIKEMRSRYRRFEAVGARNIQTYNRKMPSSEDRIPYLVFVVDELADLMMTAPAEVEQSLCRLAQLGRATGIHLVVATQRPSVDVLTGLIKANIPSRISFAVSSQVDARTILDGAGAEKLLGRGDMLFMPAGAAKPKRLQGAFISDDEVQALVEHWKGQRGRVPTAVNLEPPPEPEPADDDVSRARDLAAHHSRVSASLLQRKLGIGYAKAASLLDHLEEMGVVGPGDPGKSRTVIGSE